MLAGSFAILLALVMDLVTCDFWSSPVVRSGTIFTDISCGDQACYMAWPPRIWFPLSMWYLQYYGRSPYYADDTVRANSTTLANAAYFKCVLAITRSGDSAKYILQCRKSQWLVILEYLSWTSLYFFRWSVREPDSLICVDRSISLFQFVQPQAIKCLDFQLSSDIPPYIIGWVTEDDGNIGAEVFAGWMTYSISMKTNSVTRRYRTTGMGFRSLPGMKHGHVVTFCYQSLLDRVTVLRIGHTEDLWNFYDTSIASKGV